MSEIEFLDESDRPKPARRLTIGAIMALLAPVALLLALARGHELVGGLIAAWGAILLGLVESVKRRTGQSLVRAGAIICLIYPWLAAGLGSFLLAYGQIRPRPVGAEFVSALVLVILVGVPVALVGNYYLVLAEIYPAHKLGESTPVAQAEVRPLVLASVASWLTGLPTLFLILIAFS